MTRTNDVKQEDTETRRKEMIAVAAEGGVERAVGRMGGELMGLSVKVGEWDYLVTLRALFPAGMMVCFVGGPSIGECLRKAVSMGMRDDLRWREDNYRT